MINFAWSNSGAHDGTSFSNAKIVEFDYDEDPQMIAANLNDDQEAWGYISVGTVEDWRDDADDLAAYTKGSYGEWEGEEFLDIDDRDELLKVMEKRMDKLQEAGFSAVEFDNIDFGASSQSDQVDDIKDYAVKLAAAAHERGMKAIMKNGGGSIANDLVDHFDGVILESMEKYPQDMEQFKVYADQGKPVYNFTYGGESDKAKAAQLLSDNPWMSGNYYDFKNKTTGYTKVSRSRSVVGAQFEKIPHPLDDQRLIGRVADLIAIDIARAIFVKRALSGTVVGVLLITVIFTVGLVVWLIKRKTKKTNHFI